MNRKRYRTIAELVIMLTLLSGSAFAIPATAADNRYITISATGTTTIVPDAVRITAIVSSLFSTSKDALAATSSTASAIRKVLALNAVAAKDIATQSLTIYPEYSYPTSSAPILSGYRASQSFRITVRAPLTAGLLVDTIVEAGGNNLQVNEVSPIILDDNKATELARANAVNRAKSKATSYAKLLGVKLGRVIYLHEAVTTPSYPIYATTAKSSSDSTVIDLGEQQVSVSVTIRWAISHY